MRMVSLVLPSIRRESVEVAMPMCLAKSVGEIPAGSRYSFRRISPGVEGLRAFAIFWYSFGL